MTPCMFYSRTSTALDYNIATLSGRDLGLLIDSGILYDK